MVDITAYGSKVIQCIFKRSDMAFMSLALLCARYSRYNITSGSVWPNNAAMCHPSNGPLQSDLTLLVETQHHTMG